MDAANVSFVWLEPTGGESELDENGFAPGHFHPFDQLMYMIEGKLQLWVGAKVYDLDAGDFIYIPRDVPHGGRPRDGSGVYLIELFAPLRTDYLYTAEHQLAAGHADRQPDGSRVDQRSMREVMVEMGAAALVGQSKD